MRLNLFVTATAVAVLAASAAAQQTSPKSSFDRTMIPKAPADPAFVLPKWTKTTLSNGAQLIVIEKHSLPLVSFTMNFVGGANQFEPADKAGVAGFTGAMMTEGTTTRTGDEISNALQLLGTNVGFGITAEGGSASFLSLNKTFDPTLAILVDELLHPAFPDAALTRRKAAAVINLRQTRDRTAGIAGVVFPKLIYSADHPYSRSQSEESVNATTRDDIVAFHKAFFQPSRAIITVVGDITPTDAKAKVEKALAAWPAGGSPATFNYPAPPAPKATAIYLVDKPGAAQSSFTIGLVGPPRNTPDYAALRVLNAVLGGELSLGSRLMANIREAKGYSYGVSSAFAYGRGPGPFRMGGDIQTDKTDSALVEFVKEVKNIRGAKPLTDDELASAKSALIARLPSQLGSTGGLSSLVNTIYVNGLPEDYWTQFSKAVNAITSADVSRVAQKYVDADHLTILIVGDRAKIEGPLKATGIAPVVVLDAAGKPIG